MFTLCDNAALKPCLLGSEHESFAPLWQVYTAKMKGIKDIVSLTPSLEEQFPAWDVGWKHVHENMNTMLAAMIFYVYQ